MPRPSDTVEDLAALLARSQRVTTFTGAGVSTESGIPDFRSPGGLWTRYDPSELTFERYVESAEVRQLSWQMRREFFAADPQPNPAHHAIAALERAGRGHGVVTQNIDGLHQLAGSSEVVEVHGTAREVGCIGAAPAGGVPAGCGFVAPYTWALERVDAGDPDPGCPECGGLVKSRTVSFGQVLEVGVMEQAAELVRTADLVLTVGSSLQVWPAADLPLWALRAGVPLAIVNDEPTPMDDFAEVVVRGRAGEVLPAAVAGIG
jgi:NAD-dependent deacetylase